MTPCDDVTELETLIKAYKQLPDDTRVGLLMGDAPSTVIRWGDIAASVMVALQWQLLVQIMSAMVAS